MRFSVSHDELVTITIPRELVMREGVIAGTVAIRKCGHSEVVGITTLDGSFVELADGMKCLITNARKEKTETPAERAGVAPA